MIELSDVSFRYPRGTFSLRIPRLSLDRTRRVAVTGKSGSGKTTLIHLIAGILRADSGTVAVDGENLSLLDDAIRRQFRIRRIGLVLQEFEILEYLSVRDNIELPYRIHPALRWTQAVRGHAEELAKSVGLDHMLHRFPHELSHGERQRVSICRALVTRPAFLIADEPTASLDDETARSILQLIFRQVDEFGTTLLMVTHDRSLLSSFEQVVEVDPFSSGGNGL